jgi:alkaline phosphatase
VILSQDRKKIEDVIQSVHARGKKFRFWATPDVVNAWITLGKLGVDYIGTDKVVDLNKFMKETPHVTFTNADVHRVAPAPVLPASTAVARNIIFLIGDGMGLAQQYAGYTANHGALNLFTMPVVGLSITTSADRYITDSAAGATAMASGKKTNNRAVGVDSLSRPIPSIIAPLRQHGFRTGVISTGDITDATPAAFYGHSADRASSEVIAADFLSSDIDVLIGAGSGHFLQRKDGRDLRGELQQKGYTVATDVRTLDTLRSSKFVLLDNTMGLSMKQGRGHLLATTLDKTLQTFSTGPSPFFIMAEGAQIDWGGHSNDMEYVVREMLNFDEVVGRAMQYVAKHPETLLVVTADHETGGLTLLDGNLKTGDVRGHFSTDDHTATPVMVFAYGAGASNFAGVYQNTELYKKMLKVLGIQP